VKFIEGPTQKTLPNYIFNHKLQIVLIDGPHGYPFPELEYFFFYPNIEKNGLLLIDDIQIPTIRNMFKILKADDMWKLLDVIDDFAIFQRTEAPLIDPYSDSWWLQGYNLSLVKQNKMKEKMKHFIPKSIASRTPNFIKRFISKLFSVTN
jgi:hypothetical protein